MFVLSLGCNTGWRWLKFPKNSRTTQNGAPSPELRWLLQAMGSVARFMTSRLLVVVGVGKHRRHIVAGESRKTPSFAPSRQVAKQRGSWVEKEAGMSLIWFVVADKSIVAGIRREKRKKKPAQKRVCFRRSWRSNSGQHGSTLFIGRGHSCKVGVAMYRGANYKKCHWLYTLISPPL